MNAANNVLKGALNNLRPLQKAGLLHKLISAFDEPDGKIDKLWAKEAEDRMLMIAERSRLFP